MEDKAGWYAQDEGGERYWNGKSWTAATRASAGSPVRAAEWGNASSTATASGLSARFVKSANFWRAAFGWIAIIGSLLIAISFGSASNSLGMAIGSGLGFALVMLPWIGLFSVVASWANFQRAVHEARTAADA